MSARLRRSLPIVGTVLAVATIAATMRRKGVISGALDTGLNAIPFVGASRGVEICFPTNTQSTGADKQPAGPVMRRAT